MIVVPVAIAPGPAVPDSGLPEPTFDAQYEAFNAWERNTAAPGMNALANATYQNALESKARAESASASEEATITANTSAVASAAAASASAVTASTKAGEAAASAATAAGAAGAAGASALNAAASAAAAAAAAVDAEGYAASVSAAPLKAVPNDADKIGGLDSTASFSVFGMNFGALKTWLAEFFVSTSGGTIAGSFNLSGAARRITGDFSTPTLANRTMLQTNVENAASDPAVLPNGTSTTAAFSVFNNSDPANAAFGQFSARLTDVRISSNISGSGSFLPITTFVSNNKNTEQPVAGGFFVTGGAFGYGIGAGGTVTQATSKSTGVTLNKPSGRITMHGAALGAGAIVSFSVNNSLVSEFDAVTLSGLQIHDWANYRLGSSVSNGVFFINLQNVSAASRSEALVINFEVVKGSGS